MTEKEILKDFISIAEKINKNAGIDITGKEEEIIQRARWVYLMNKLGNLDDIQILLNMVIEEQRKIKNNIKE